MPSTVNDREMRGSDFRVGISKQAVKDVVDVNPIFTPVRRTEGKNMKNVSYVEDPSVNGMFQGKEQIKENESFSAELQCVVTKQSIDWLIQSLHADTVELEVIGVDIAFTATGLTSVADGFTDMFVGQGFWVTGSTGGTNDLFFVVKQIIDDGEIVTEPAPTIQAAGPSITILSYVSQNRDLPTYNIMQTRGTDLSQADDVNYYSQYNGVLNQCDMEIPETGLWSTTGNFVFETEYVNNPLAIPGQTYTAPPSDRAVTSARNATPGIKYFYVDNVRQTCKVKSLSFTVNNNYQEDPFAACPSSYYRGDFQVSGSFIMRSLISNPFTWRDKCWNSTRFSIAFMLTHGGGDETYVIFHQNVATEATQPDGSGTVAHTEVSFGSEEKLDIETTVTVTRNWV